jgi:hypothetical protein
MGDLIRKARAAKVLREEDLRGGTDRYGPDSYDEKCPCDMCEFIRAATPDAVLALVTVGQRDCDAPRPDDAQVEKD